MKGRDHFMKICTAKGSRWIQIRFSVIKTNARGVRQERVLTFKKAIGTASASLEDPSMWAMASNMFAHLPYSNGHDARYESVKAKLRSIYGVNSINEDNKARLKGMAKLRGAEPPLEDFLGNSRHATYHVNVSTLDGVVKKEFDVDRIVEVQKGRVGTSDLMLTFGAPFYYTMSSAMKHWEKMQQKPYSLLFGREDQRDEFATSLLWIQQSSREEYAKRQAETTRQAMLGGGKGRIFKVSYRSTKRWWPHLVAWRTKSSAHGSVIAIFRTDVKQATPLRDRVVVRFSPRKLKKIAFLSRVLWPHESVLPTNAVGLLFVIHTTSGTKRIGVIFGGEESARDFLNFAVKESGYEKTELELSAAVDELRDPHTSDGFLPSKFIGGKRAASAFDGTSAPHGFSVPERLPPPTKSLPVEPPIGRFTKKEKPPAIGGILSDGSFSF